MAADRVEASLRIWNTLALVGFLVALVMPPGTIPKTGPETFAQAIIASCLGVAVAGFYLRMLWETAFRKPLPRRALWLVLYLVMPVLSAFIYFAWTRSVDAQKLREISIKSSN